MGKRKEKHIRKEHEKIQWNKMRHNKDVSNGKGMEKGLWELSTESVTIYNLSINCGNYGL